MVWLCAFYAASITVIACWIGHRNSYLSDENDYLTDANRKLSDENKKLRDDKLMAEIEAHTEAYMAGLSSGLDRPKPDEDYYGLR